MSARIPTVGARARSACLASRVATASPSSARDVGTNVDVFPHLAARRCVGAHHGRAVCGGRAAPSFASRGFAASSASSDEELHPRGGGASSSADEHLVSKKHHADEASRTHKHVLYRGPWLLPFRTLVRFKIFQLAGVGAVSAPLSAALNNDPMSTTTMTAVAAVVGGSAACSFALQYYASRYVGELALLRGAPSAREPIDAAKKDDCLLVRVSTMNFWGKRSDTDVRVSQITPPFAGLSRQAYADLASNLFVPLDVASRYFGRGGGAVAKQHVLSLRHGALKDKKRLFQLLTGEPIDALER